MNQSLVAPAALAKPTQVRFRILGWFCTLSMITYIDRICIMQVQGNIQSDLGLTKQQFSWVFVAFSLAYAIFEMPSGWLGDLLGPRRVLTRIVLCWLLFTALTGVVWGLVSLIVIRFLFGVGEAGAYPNIARGTKNWFPFSERGRAQGLVWTFGRWGGAVAPILTIALMMPFTYLEFPGWRGAFFLLGVLGILWVLGFSWCFRDSPREHPRVNPAELDLIESQSGVAGKRPPRRSAPQEEETHILAGPPRPYTSPTVENQEEAETAILAGPPRVDASPPARNLPGDPTRFHIQHPPLSGAAMLTSPTLWCLSIMYFCSNSGWSIFMTYVTPYLENVQQLRGWQLALASGMPLFLGGVGCLLGGFLTDRMVPLLGRRWGRTLQGLIAYAMGGLLFVLAIIAGKENPVLAFWSICLASFVKDFAMAASWSTTIDIGHRYSGTVAGFMNTIGNFGTVVTAPIAAYIAVRYGSEEAPNWSASLYYYATMFFLASVCWLFINPRQVIVYSPEDRQRLREQGALD